MSEKCSLNDGKWKQELCLIALSQEQWVTPYARTGPLFQPLGQAGVMGWAGPGTWQQEGSGAAPCGRGGCDREPLPLVLGKKPPPLGRGTTPTSLGTALLPCLPVTQDVPVTAC